MTSTQRERLKADVKRIVEHHFANRSPEYIAFLNNVEQVEMRHPCVSKYGVPAAHPLGTLS